MNLGLERIDDILIVTIPGPVLDVVHADEFKRAVYPVLAEETKVVLDIAKLDFVDSSGLGAIVACVKMLRVAGGDLKVCGMTRQARWLFDLLKMHTICGLFDAREEAVESFKTLAHDGGSTGDAMDMKASVREMNFRKINQQE